MTMQNSSDFFPENDNILDFYVLIKAHDIEMEKWAKQVKNQFIHEEATWACPSGTACTGEKQSFSNPECWARPPPGSGTFAEPTFS